MPLENDQAIALPTKRFFVSMLTRDISLEDAILDLVDNCLDGAMRDNGGSLEDYSSYKVELFLESDSFIIRDNCGGIPREIARNYAFKMGREPDDNRDNNSETIGMYGIGMKRAMFKMGERSLVRTCHSDDQYEVEINQAWLEDSSWNPLPIVTLDLPELKDVSGTQIVVTGLFPGVARHFCNGSFVEELRKSIGEHFSTFLQKGLSVEVNGVTIAPALVEVLVSDDPDTPAPFFYRNEIDGVLVSIVVGLNSGRVFEDEGDYDFERDRSASTAGWTIFCNDRAVIVGDKSMLTGWGDDLPRYHAQFSVITGIVEFRSVSSDKLPITTTKRALDTSSEVWLIARTKMKEGLRIWIAYTNDWKNNPRSDQTVHWDRTRPASFDRAVEVLEKKELSRKADGGYEFNPKKKHVLPTPVTKTPSARRVVFSRPIEDIKEMSHFFYDSADVKAGIVGEASFQFALEQSRITVEKGE